MKPASVYVVGSLRVQCEEENPQEKADAGLGTNSSLGGTSTGA